MDTTVVNFNQAPADGWRAVAHAASLQGKLADLVRTVAGHPNTGSVRATSLLARLMAEPEPAATPGTRPEGPASCVADESFEVALLWNDLPFINRGDLRRKLKLMVCGDGRRALLVTGDRGSGKTYTRQFIRFIAEQGGPRRIHPIDVSLRAGTPVDERELSASVASVLLGKEPPPFDPTAQPETVVSRFRTWLSNAVEELHEPAWLVLDGFTSRTATGGALQLIAELAAAAASRDLGPVRVVVLGYLGNPVNAGPALVEPITHPTQADVKRFFGGAAVALQGQAPDDQALDALLEAFTVPDHGGPLERRSIAEISESASRLVRSLYGGTT